MKNFYEIIKENNIFGKILNTIKKIFEFILAVILIVTTAFMYGIIEAIVLFFWRIYSSLKDFLIFEEQNG